MGTFAVSSRSSIKRSVAEEPSVPVLESIVAASRRFSLPDSGDEALEAAADPPPPRPCRVFSRYQRSNDRRMPFNACADGCEVIITQTALVLFCAGAKF